MAEEVVRDGAARAPDVVVEEAGSDSECDEGERGAAGDDHEQLREQQLGRKALPETSPHQIPGPMR